MYMRCSSNRTRATLNLTTATNAKFTRAAATAPSKKMLTTTSSVSPACPVILSVLVWSVTLLLVSSCLGIADCVVLFGHPLGRRAFNDIQCKGVYDRSNFARLNRICEDCYNLFREPQLLALCRGKCFTSDYFKGCVTVLLRDDEMQEIQTWVDQLRGPNTTAAT